MYIYIHIYIYTYLQCLCMCELYIIPKYVTLRIKLSRFPFKNLDAIHLWCQTEVESLPLTIFHGWTNPDSTHACSPMTGWRMWNVFVCDGSGSWTSSISAIPALFQPFEASTEGDHCYPTMWGSKSFGHRQEMPSCCWCSGVMDRWLCCCVSGWGPNGDPTGTGTEDVFRARDPPQVRHWKNRNPKSKSHNGIIQKQMKSYEIIHNFRHKQEFKGWFWMIYCGSPCFLKAHYE